MIAAANAVNARWLNTVNSYLHYLPGYKIMLAFVGNDKYPRIDFFIACDRFFKQVDFFFLICFYFRHFSFVVFNQLTQALAFGFRLAAKMPGDGSGKMEQEVLRIYTKKYRL